MLDTFKRSQTRNIPSNLPQLQLRITRFIRNGGYIVDIKILDTTGKNIMESYSEIIEIIP